MKKNQITPLREYEIVQDEMLSLIIGGATDSILACGDNACKTNSGNCESNLCTVNTEDCIINNCGNNGCPQNSCLKNQGPPPPQCPQNVPTTT